MRWRWSLVWRMVVAVVMLAVVSVFIVALAMLVAGLAGYLLLVVFVYIPATTMAPLLGSPTAVFAPLVNYWVLISLVLGLLAFPVVYVQPARRQIREFRRELGTDGTLVDDETHKVARMIRRLSQQAGIPEPTVFIADRNRPESYAIGGASDGTIVVTKGLVGTLPDDELEAVLAHEISHLVNGDSRVIGLALVPLVVAERVNATDKPGPHWAIQFWALQVIVWGILKIVTSLQRVWAQLGIAILSRGREFEADRAAAELTGSPASLASALQRLTDERRRPTSDMRTWDQSAGALDILPSAESLQRRGPFRTHPSTDRRIRRLERLVTEMEG